MKHSEENHMVIPGPWTGNPNDPNAPEAVEPTAEEKREEEAREARELAAAEYADGLRQLADFIEASPDFKIPADRMMFSYVARLESNTKELQRRIDSLTGGIRDFLHALDRGYFGTDRKSTDLSDTAYISALRTLAEKNWGRK